MLCKIKWSWFFYLELINKNSILIVDKVYTVIQKYHHKVLIQKLNSKKKALMIDEFINEAVY